MPANKTPSARESMEAVWAQAHVNQAAEMARIAWEQSTAGCPKHHWVCKFVDGQELVYCSICGADGNS